MRTVIGKEGEAVQEIINGLLMLRPRINISGNKLTLMHKGKDFDVPLTINYAPKTGFNR